MSNIICRTQVISKWGYTAGSAKTQISLMLNNLKDYTSKIVKAV